jgi:hypothetical protein
VSEPEEYLEDAGDMSPNNAIIDVPIGFQLPLFASDETLPYAPCYS